jgi:signal transduction histidine kinase
MSALRLPTALGAAVAAASAAALAAWALPGGHGAVDRAFATAILTALGLLVVRVAGEWREARQAASRARERARIEPDQVARAAVRAERERLMGEISAGLRVLLVDVRDAALEGSVDPSPGTAAEHIHDRSRAATAELRRQLGLLRSIEEPRPPASAVEGAVVATPSRGDVLLAAVASALAAVESVLWPSLDGRSVSAASVVLGALAAGTVVARHAWPVRGALACAGLFLLGVALAVPLYPGFWFLLSVCVLLWAVAARRGGPWQAGGAVAVLAAAVLVQVWLTEPQNVAFDAVTMGIAVGGSLLVRTARARAGRARERAAGADAELTAAARGAVDAERAVIAREIHDTVSHAVGLIAVQAAAALVSAEHEPDAARDALDLVRRTADSALDDLDAAAVGTVRPRTRVDLEALVARIRAAGTPVELEGDWPGEDLPEPVYRVVQESLTNVVRHAPGARARVRFAVSPQHLLVEVTDDGPGISTGAERGYGLVGLAERVRFAGGSLTTSPGPGGSGFRVRAAVPTPSGVCA